MTEDANSNAYFASAGEEIDLGNRSEVRGLRIKFAVVLR